MASKAKKDPLSRYFQDMDEFDISSGEESEEMEQVNQSTPVPSKPPMLNRENTKDTPENGKSKQTTADNKTKETPSLKKLPSAHDCLNSQSSPAFLRLNPSKEVDWDKQLKSLEDPEGGNPVDFETNAVPPPTSYEPVTDPGIKVVDSDGNKRKRIEDELGDQTTTTKAYKVHKEETEDDT